MKRSGISRRGNPPILLVILILAALGISTSTMSPTGTTSRNEERVVTTPAPSHRDSTPSFDRARGLVYGGLIRGAGACRGAWAAADHPAMCTHGPDRSPPGGVVTRRRSTAELADAATQQGTAGATSLIPCYGDGSSGKRVQVVYAHAADVPDRFDELASLITQWTANVDDAFKASAAETGGTRHVRWVTDATCNLDIERVQLTTTGDDTFTATMTELGSVGLQRSDRKYLIWADADVYCGIGNLYIDDVHDLTNRNNTRTGYARTDTGCWGSSWPIEAHELMHTLGGVQYTAPHSSGGGHCTDGYDRMCYSDGAGVTLTYPCPSTDHGRLFDCNHEDYFSTSPAAGSYLATHWNTAASEFLESVEPSDWSPPTPTPTPSPSPTRTSPSPSPSPTTSTTPSPSPSPTLPTTSTATFTGTLSKKNGSRSYALDVGSGDVDATLTFSKASALTLTFLRADGSTIATRTAASPVALHAIVPSGAYSFVVGGAARGNVWFRLTVTYEGA
ncbi:MAG: hypothetical protein WAT66_02290 [Actinomycetota bacterium]